MIEVFGDPGALLCELKNRESFEETAERSEGSVLKRAGAADVPAEGEQVAQCVGLLFAHEEL